MQYNPFTKTLWDDDGKLLKKVHCPKAASRAQIAQGRCQLCDYEVVTLDALPESNALLGAALPSWWECTA